MKNQPFEKEVKFYLQNLTAIQKRLEALGARLISARTHEYNLRFDTPQATLSTKAQVLRLRKDAKNYLTFKDAADPSSGVASRREIEFEISSFENTQTLLEALGYVVFIAYEKFRTTYALNECEVVLDEMPFGIFAEIEGPDEATIRQASQMLGLNWEARSKLSYLALFEILKKAKNLSSEHILFASLPADAFSAADFGLMPADLAA